MKSWRKSLAVLTLSAASVLTAAIGYNLFENVQFARAEQQVEASRQQLAAAQDLSSVFREVSKAVSPSVVSIRVTKTIKAPAGLGSNQDRLRRFFHDLNPDTPLPPDLFAPEDGERPGEPDEGGRSFREIGMGSGVIMDVNGSTGYIVTNNHVAGDASEMEVTLADGREIKEVKLVGADPKTDLAVVQINADRLIAAKWGDSTQLQKGDWIIAFGSPFGYVGSMTHGIVSALDRQAGILGATGYEDFIQVDAPINPGNSGGPLVNLQGQVVGVNTAIASRTGGFQGIGFAVPSKMARPIYETLKEKGKITRGWLGIQIGDVSKFSEQARSVGYQGNTGILVQGILKDTPAMGKLQPGDVITTLDGKETRSVTDFRNQIAFTAPGSEVTLGVVREGKNQDVNIKIGEQPASLLAQGEGRSDRSPTTMPTLGMRITDLSNDLAQRFGLSAASGAVVSDVRPGSLAAQAGVRPGDLITRVDDEKVSNAADAQQALGKANVKNGVRLYITNREGSQLLVIQSAGGR